MIDKITNYIRRKYAKFIDSEYERLGLNKDYEEAIEDAVMERGLMEAACDMCDERCDNIEDRIKNIEDNVDYIKWVIKRWNDVGRII